jgi:hypothetical protein
MNQFGPLELARLHPLLKHRRYTFLNMSNNHNFTRCFVACCCLPASIRQLSLPTPPSINKCMFSFVLSQILLNLTNFFTQK